MEETIIDYIVKMHCQQCIDVNSSLLFITQGEAGEMLVHWGDIECNCATANHVSLVKFA